MSGMWDRADYRCHALVEKGLAWNGKQWDEGPHQCPRDTKDPGSVLCWQHREQVYQAVRLSERRKAA